MSEVLIIHKIFVQMLIDYFSFTDILILYSVMKKYLSCVFEKNDDTRILLQMYLIDEKAGTVNH